MFHFSNQMISSLTCVLILGSLCWPIDRGASHLNHLSSLKNGGTGGSLEFTQFLADHPEQIESQNFEIHYSMEGNHAIDTSDVDQNGVIDYLESVIDAFETSWSYYLVEHSYNLPRWPTEKYPVFLRNLPAEFYGYMNLYGFMGDHPETSEIETTSSESYVVMRNEYNAQDFENPLQALQVTAAHEFFHAIQSAYSIEHNLWSVEGSATAMESRVFPEIQDNFQYNYSWFEYSDLSFNLPTEEENEFRDRVYGSWVYFEYLENTYPGAIAEITVKAVKYDDALSLIDDYLLAKGVNTKIFLEEMTKSFLGEYTSLLLDQGSLKDDAKLSVPTRLDSVDGYEIEAQLGFGLWDSDQDGDGIWRGNSFDLVMVPPLSDIHVSFPDLEDYGLSYLDVERAQWVELSDSLPDQSQYQILNTSEQPYLLALYHWGSNQSNQSYQIHVKEFDLGSLSQRLSIRKIAGGLVFLHELNELVRESLNFKYTLYDINGEIALSGQLDLENGSEYRLDLTPISSEGVYYLRVGSPDAQGSIVQSIFMNE